MILRQLWAKAMEKLGKFAAFLPMVGSQLAIDLEAGDVGITGQAAA